MLDSRRAAYDWVLDYLLKPNLGHNLFVHTSHHFLFPKLRACLYGGGGPQVGEVTFGGSPHLSCKRDQINMRDYMDRRMTPPKRVTSLTWGPQPPCKQTLTVLDFLTLTFAIWLVMML